jgi:addiction module HigA family antidote
MITMNDPAKQPLHPGEILREEFMVPNRLSSNALAGHLRVTTARINEIANEQRGITADTALRLARFFNTTAEFWMDLQKQSELHTARIESGARIHNEITPLGQSGNDQQGLLR